MGPALAIADEASLEEPLEATADEADPLDANSGGTVNVYRLYNRSTSEHLYTTSRTEYDSLPSKGPWTQEGVAWVAPKKSSTPVYRLYNKKLGDHHYTTSKGERDSLVNKSGWRNEGVGFYAVRKGSNAGVEVDQNVRCTVPAGTYRGNQSVSYAPENNPYYSTHEEITLVVRRDSSFEIRDPNGLYGENLTRFSGYISGTSVEYKCKGWEWTDTMIFSYHGGSRPYVEISSSYVGFSSQIVYLV